MGFQHQLDGSTSIQADYVWTRERSLAPTAFGRNINLSFNPATGANFPFSNLRYRPYPDMGRILVIVLDQYANYHGLETAFTKRLSKQWQASATYTLSFYKDSNPLPINPGCQYPMNGLTMTCNTPFPVSIAPDLGGEYTYAEGDQRHRAVVNGIWDLPYEVQLSGIYSFGSGLRFSTSYGGDLRDSGTSSNRLRPDGTITPRNALVGQPLHRLDVRMQKRFRLVGRARVEGLVEVFNVFNHANYGAYATAQASPAYGRPAQQTGSGVLSAAYSPRMLQLGFRFLF
jgi:hypothetical protein